MPDAASNTLSNPLQTLRQYTTVVADTGDIDAIRTHQPTDATTNPSLILKAVQQTRYRPLLERIVRDHPHADLATLADHLLVAFGREILALIPGRISTEVDARLSFDTAATLLRAQHLINLYEQAGMERERVLIKIAATWEGIQAARALQAHGIRCNLTLLFSLEQAIACAQAGVQLISPFVGRIYDWYKEKAGAAWNEAAHAGADDPGVQSVRTIYHHYKTHGVQTEIMGASFRNMGQIRALAGCDLLTISPELLGQLAQDTAPLVRQLFPETAEDLQTATPPHLSPHRPVTEVAFRTALNEDAMTSDKLAEGIRIFSRDARRLDELLTQTGN